MKILFILLYVFLLTAPVVSWVANSGWDNGFWYGYMRLAGMYAFVLITTQIISGSSMDTLRRVFGPRILKGHMAVGIMAFLLAMSHPVAFGIAFGWNLLLDFSDPYTVLGRIGLLCMILGVSGGMLRTKSFMVSHWRVFHRLNYAVFILIYVHSFYLGSDVRIFPMSGVYIIGPLAVLYSVARKYLLSGRGEQVARMG